MDANDTQLVVKLKHVEVLAYRWSGNRADLIHAPEWLRSLVYNWEFKPMGDFQFRYELKLFYNGTRARAISVLPGEFILRIGELLVVLSDEAFRAIFMEDDREESV